jgi:signal transduction histidine kinase
VRQIEASAAQMNRMIEEILDFSKLQAGVPLQLSDEPTDMVELLRGVVEEYRGSRSHHEIELASPDGPLVGQWDPNRLHRVFSNLLDNAVKYSPNGSTVRVAAETEPLEAEHRQGRGEAKQESADAAGSIEWIRVSITDQGIGIPAEDLAHIFEWYGRASNADSWASGTGIGLAAARQIVQQYGGTITVDSVEGEGTTVAVLLPLPAADRAG